MLTRYEAEEKAMAMLGAPDGTIAESFLSNYRSKQLTPERKLMIAILEDAISYLKKPRARSENGRVEASRLRTESLWWIHSNLDHLFSFNSICEELGMNPSCVRAALDLVSRDVHADGQIVALMAQRLSGKGR